MVTTELEFDPTIDEDTDDEDTGFIEYRAEIDNVSELKSLAKVNKDVDTVIIIFQYDRVIFNVQPLTMEYLVEFVFYKDGLVDYELPDKNQQQIIPIKSLDYNNIVKTLMSSETLTLIVKQDHLLLEVKGKHHRAIEARVVSLDNIVPIDREYNYKNIIESQRHTLTNQFTIPVSMLDVALKMVTDMQLTFELSDKHVEIREENTVKGNTFTRFDISNEDDIQIIKYCGKKSHSIYKSDYLNIAIRVINDVTVIYFQSDGPIILYNQDQNHHYHVGVAIGPRIKEN